ncbi:hypothetical protein K3495_g710 [Podosphaera aphanis]|nr:hypothetical protein K3495_g710 [Podosphaera aphanis]
MSSVARVFRPLASQVITRSSRHNVAKLSPALFQARALSASSTLQAKKYTKDHEWIEVSENGKTGTIGISDYAAHALGDIVYVELPEIPMEVTAGDAIGAVESVKSASDINAPVSCTITAVNKLLEEKPATINAGPENTSSDGGWYAKVELSEDGVKDLKDLMDAEEYKELIDLESH